MTIHFPQRFAELFGYMLVAGLNLLATLQALWFSRALPSERRYRFFGAATFSAFIWLFATAYVIEAPVDALLTPFAYQVQSAGAVGFFAFITVYFRIETQAKAGVLYWSLLAAYLGLFISSWIFPVGVFADRLDLAMLAEAHARGISAPHAFAIGPIAYTASFVTLLTTGVIGFWSIAAARKKPTSSSRLLRNIVVFYLVCVTHDLVRNLTGFGLPFMLTVFEHAVLILLLNQRMVAEIIEGSRIKRALTDSEERWRITLESISDGIFVTDASSVLRAVNPAGGRLLQRPPDTLLGMEIDTGLRLSTAAGPYLTDLRQRIFNSDEGVSAARLDLTRTDGSVLAVGLSAAPIVDGEKRRVGMVVVLRDLSQQVAGEARLQRARDMELLTQLAASTAHDFNNLITVIRQSGSRLLEGTRDRPELNAEAAALNDASATAAALVVRLMGLGKSRSGVPALLNIDTLAARIARIAAQIAEPNVQVTTSLHAKPAVVKADPTALEAALLNVARNGLLAMPNGGTLEIYTEVEELTPSGSRLLLLAPAPGSYVVVRVRDTGSGIAPEIQGRIFEPFFSTRSPGEGAGLGLPMVMSTVAEAGGGLAVASEVGHGTTLSLYLPRRGEEPAAATAPPAPEPLPPEDSKGVSQRILVVDDTELVRRSITGVLTDAGYRVIEAPDGETGLARFRVHGAQLALVDLSMPRMSGTETIERLRQLSPDLRVIVATGYTAGPELRAALRIRGVVALAKPFEAQELLNLIADMLGHT